MSLEYILCPQSTVFQFQENSYVRRVQFMSSKYSFWLQRTVYVLRAQLMFPEYNLSP